MLGIGRIHRLPRVAESGIPNHFPVRQTAQECQQVHSVLLCQCESGYVLVLIRIIVTAAGVRASCNRASSGGVVIDHLFESGNTSVVHVGRGKGDVP
jgi:hypothetical protein